MNQVNSKQVEMVVGQRIHSILYGGRDGVIVEIDGAQCRASVRNLGGVIAMGGNAQISVVWDNGSQSKGVPEAIVRGVQWRIFDEVVGPEVVAERLAAAAIYDAQAKAKADQAVRVMQAAMAECERIGRALGLIPEAEFRAAGKRGSAAAFNLRAELKKAGIKASVKQDGYNCLRVDVAKEDKAQAEQIGRKYKAGSFDGMSDCYVYDSSAWGRVFGDVQYVFVN